MRIDAQLLPRGSADQPLRLVWDSDAGTLQGADATVVDQLVRAYAGKPWGIPSRYPPESWLVTDPLHDPRDMALLLGSRFTLPPELEALYPAFDGADLPDGTVA